MRKRYVVLGLSAVLALAVAVPAIGQSSDPTATASLSLSGVNKKAKKALKKAKAANKKANQALNETDDLNVRVTNIEQAGGGGGGVGPQGPPGPQGPAGPAGPAGTAAGATFFRTLDGESSNVSAGGFSLTFSADNAGNCNLPELQSRNNSWFWASDQDATDFEGDLDADALLTGLTDDDTSVVTARTNSGSARAQWEFGLSNNVDGDCFVAGTVFGT